MSIRPFTLDGWEDESAWGFDDGLGSYYAKLTRNGSDHGDGPEIWITRGWNGIALVGSEDQLVELISQATGIASPQVYTAMHAGDHEPA